MVKKILRLQKVKIQTGLSKSSIYTGISEGTFPKQIKLGERAVGWLESEIVDFIDSRIQQRDMEASKNE